MNPTFFWIGLVLSLATCLGGLGYRVSRWFHLRIGPDATGITPLSRVAAAVRGTAGAVFSRRLAWMVKAFVLDGLFQARILKDGFLAWLAHIFVFWGFLALLLMHALDETLTANLFPGYVSTLSPFLFLRNLFGLLVVVGIALGLGRRVVARRARPRMTWRDRFALGVLALILVSGVALEGAKIVSEPVFREMAEEYAGISAGSEELRPLQRYWASEHGVVFRDQPTALDGDGGDLERGRATHEQSCAFCHSPPRTAFLSYAVARAIAPAAPGLNAIRADVWLLCLHVTACFAGLALLPFARLFHIVADPVSLLASAGVSARGGHPANAVTRRAIGLDACVQCGRCDERCSVAPVGRVFGQVELLPSRKVLSTRSLADGKPLGRDALQLASEGAFLCTSCRRCAETCPAGIDLTDLWSASRADLAGLGYPAPQVWIRERGAADWAEMAALAVSGVPADRAARPRRSELSDDPKAFSACIQCQTCTNVCPVVAHNTSPEVGVDLTPQKVMNLLRLGLKDMAMGSRMVWECATCYQCQEHCPEGIPVTDIHYELRNLAYERLRGVDRRVGAGAPAETDEKSDWAVAPGERKA